MTWCSKDRNEQSESAVRTLVLRMISNIVRRIASHHPVPKFTGRESNVNTLNIYIVYDIIPHNLFLAVYGRYNKSTKPGINEMSFHNDCNSDIIYWFQFHILSKFQCPEIMSVFQWPHLFSWYDVKAFFFHGDVLIDSLWILCEDYMPLGLCCLFIVATRHAMVW